MLKVYINLHIVGLKSPANKTYEPLIIEQSSAMNQTYRLVWSLTQQAWVVAGELAKANKKSSLKTCSIALLLAGVAFGGQAIAGPALNTLPTGETVVSGRATFDRSVDKQLTINQSTNKLITNWNSFDVGSAAKVNFVQPNTNSIALNRVTSGSPTEVFGQVTANGRLVLVNPNGITFGGRSQVSANALIASVLDIQDSDFNNSTLLFSRGNATGSIENRGKLTATAGSVSLLAPTVKNSGSITVTRGDVNLVNADAVQLSSVTPPAVTTASINGLIQQSGKISATQVSGVGGKIFLKNTYGQVQLAGALSANQTKVNASSVFVNGELNINGPDNFFDVNSSNGFNLGLYNKINLNGANSRFSVNGNFYTVIHDVKQLQDMSANLAGKYVLANDIDARETASWNAGAGFNPIGNNENRFSGTLDGFGHTINELNIYRPTTNYVGLIGFATYTSTLKNIALVNVRIRGMDYTGALSGFNDSDRLHNNYSTGRVTGRDFVGGLVGALDAGLTTSYSAAQVAGRSATGGLVGTVSPYAAVRYSYSTGKVTGDAAVGGLIGTNEGHVSYSYASGSVQGRESVGGVVGYNDWNATVSSVYSNGPIRGDAALGGVVGHNEGLASYSYWDKQTSGLSSSVGAGEGGRNITGLDSTQMKRLDSFEDWDIGLDIFAEGGYRGTWRIYEGQTAPLLSFLLKPIDVVIGNQSKTYDGQAFKGGSYSLSDPAAILQGSLSYAGNAQGARNAGTYTISGNGLYSGQQGYDIRIVDGSLTIDKKALTISAVQDNKVYDGKLTSVGKPVVTGLVDGDYIVLLKQAYSDKNVGTGKTIHVDGGYLIRDKNNGDNYTVTVLDSTSSVITPKALTISTVANSKVYNGNVSAAAKPLVTGLVAGDSVSGLFEQYETKEVGTGKKLLIKAGYVVNDGNGGNNYAVTEQTSNNGVITAH